MLGFSTKLAATQKSLDEILDKLSDNPVGLDTESSGPRLISTSKRADGTHKLKDMVNMFQATTTGFSLAFPDKTSYYIPLRHARGANAPLRPAVQLLKHVLDGSRPVWAHHAGHELLALADLGIEPPPTLYCSMVAVFHSDAFPGEEEFGLKYLSEKYLDHRMQTFEEVTGGGTRVFADLDPQSGLQYACEDAVGALVLSEMAMARVEHKSWMFDVEFPLVRILTEMHTEGVCIDHEEMQYTTLALERQAGRIARQFYDRTGFGPSRDKMVQSLFYDGSWTTGRKTKTGFAVDADELERLIKIGGPGGELAQLIFDYREANKLASTYGNSLLAIASQYPDGRLHPGYHQTGTATGRLSSSYPNGQQFPSHSDLAKSVLENLIAPEGAMIGSCDFSQIDLRVLAHFAGGGLAEAYRNNEDIHQRTANLVECSRQEAKTVNFAKIYGAHEKTLGIQLGVSKAQAGLFMAKYEEQYPEVVNCMHRIVTAAYRRGYVKTLGGRKRWFPDMKKRNPDLIANGFKAVRMGLIGREELMDALGDERKAGNTVCQGGAADLMKAAMVKIHKQRPTWFRFFAQIHDDVRWYVMDATEARVKESVELVETCMREAMTLNIPIGVESKTGSNWAQLKG